MRILKPIAKSWRRALRGSGHRQTAGGKRASTSVAGSLQHAIERFSYFQGVLHLVGWVHAPDARLKALSLELPNGRLYPLDFSRLPSPDLAAMFGPVALNSRFQATVGLDVSPAEVAEATLLVTLKGRAPVRIDGLGAAVGDPAHELFGRFQELLRQRAPGRLLEVGSRARSGVVRRDLAPPGWEYSGLDVMDGPNVDVVGDAHRLSSLYPRHHFDAIMACSVLEHLMMPWKFVVELNRVLKPGAIGVFTTHQCWPLHDQPWDFWRFSDMAWTGLLNAATGFEIMAARMGEPAFVVAQKLQPVTAFAEVPAGALASFVLFRKASETTLDWPVELAAITNTAYPSDVIAVDPQASSEN